PLAGDAGGIGRERRRDADGGAHLPAVRGVEGRAGARVGCAGAGGVRIAAGVTRPAGVHRAAARDATAARRGQTFRRRVRDLYALAAAGGALEARRVLAGFLLVRLHARTALAARRRAEVVVGVPARRAVRDVRMGRDAARMGRIARIELAAGNLALDGCRRRAGRARRRRGALARRLVAAEVALIRVAALR